MENTFHRPNEANNQQSNLVRDFSSLTIRILRYANRGVTQVSFLRAILNSLMKFSRCDAVELFVDDSNFRYRCEIKKRPRRSFTFTSLGTDCGSQKAAVLEKLIHNIMYRKVPVQQPQMTRNGAFWVNDTNERISLKLDASSPEPEIISFPDEYQSIALLPFVLPDDHAGLLQLKSLKTSFFSEEDIIILESVAQTVGLAIADRKSRHDCHERVKELTCLYGIARIIGMPELTLDEMLLNIAALLPPAWQYPHITTARILVDEKVYELPNFKQGVHSQVSEIIINGKVRGTVEVYYLEEKPFLYEGPFLIEERQLIDAVARVIALLIDRRETVQYKKILEEQLRHADRLATIGQLAAGIAHELNEPLGAILGFSQLMQKDPGLPLQCTSDLEKIVKACLHAREVVRKLLLFSRQMPAQKIPTDINKLILEGLYLLESRCAKQHISVIKDLADNVPIISVDPALIHQVLVNLIVNAVQVMPDGGNLTIRTRLKENMVALIVEDTGPGITEEVKERIFVPFFTTKQIGQGTGLGLSVVHGIVTSHGGRIEVESEVGKGAIFTVFLPVNSADKKETASNDGDG